MNGAPGGGRSGKKVVRYFLIIFWKVGPFQIMGKPEGATLETTIHPWQHGCMDFCLSKYGFSGSVFIQK